ncbi:MAG: phosphotransferase [Clostridia bacterium]
MMETNKNDIIAYLKERQVFNCIKSIEPINVGASGAKLYIIDDNNKKYVLKTAQILSNSDNSNWDLYKKELKFYTLNKELKLTYIPNTVYSEIHDKYGIILVMDYYKPIKHNQWDIRLQKQAVDLCARFNSIGIDDISPLNLQCNKSVIDKPLTQKSYLDWKLVLSQHKGRFDESILDEIYEKIETVCHVLNNGPHYICHGDFHPENILYSKNQLYLCDFQNICIGKGIGDISFFISRGNGFGLNMNADDLIEYYCERLSKYKKTNIDKKILLKEKHASTVLNIFSFWSYYLRDSPYERVAAQYNEMVYSYKCLLN